MPELAWLYLTALLCYRTSGSCVALAEVLETVSHDRLTRMLQGDWSGQTLPDLAVRTLFTWKGGYLSLDDTVIPKPFATAMEDLSWVFSNQEHKPIYGFSPRLRRDISALMRGETGGRPLDLPLQALQLRVTQQPWQLYEPQRCWR
jgi:hypothetical protein